MSTTVLPPDGSPPAAIKHEDHGQSAPICIAYLSQNASSFQERPEAIDEPGPKRQRLDEHGSRRTTSASEEVSWDDQAIAMVNQDPCPLNLQDQRIRDTAACVPTAMEQIIGTVVMDEQHSACAGNEVVPPAEVESRHAGRNINTSPHLLMRVLCLPALESLSTQIVSILSQNLYEESAQIPTDSNSVGKAYESLKALFIQTRDVYAKDALFLSADDLGLHEPEHRAVIRLTNIATFVSAMYEGKADYGAVHDNFIDIFTPDGKPLERDTAVLFLDLKTQLYFMALTDQDQDRTKREILHEWFPDELENLLAARHPSPLSCTEIEFIEEARGRRESFMLEPTDPKNLQILSEKYAWGNFLQDMSRYLVKNYSMVITPYMERYHLVTPGTRRSPSNSSIRDVPPEDMPAKSIEDMTPKVSNAVPGLPAEDEIATQAILAAQTALQSVGYDYHSLQQHIPPNSSLYNTANHAAIATQQQAYGSQPLTVNHILQDDESNEPPPPSQSAPTRVLYARARQAAAAKSNPTHARREGSPSQRRPWTTIEENSLMAGLDQVKGPHWSQILALYGRNGTISTILKDRNQVQLKDKARNLKLFFLKSGIEVPYYLKNVTGCLKTRAPTQAARKEAEARALHSTDVSQAHFNGIMTLANGFQSVAEPGPPTPTQGGPINPASEDSPKLTDNDSIGSLVSPDRDLELSEAEKDENLMRALIEVNSAMDRSSSGSPS